ncbi:zinc finger protein 845-like [Cotesia glomerata]|uniref:zinc finger protein 845-like n=1 Tax=Cotesia glomerata TaxID=32391 RepID=UPI001D00E363|nr:zinc finger protein 845-like [Cotesia glomerata]
MCKIFKSREEKYACLNPNCKSVFNDKSNRNRHFKHQCGKPPRYKCGYCDQQSHFKTNIKEHCKRRHPNFDITFSSLWLAGNFMESSIQIGPPQYACPNPNCNRVFSKKYNRNAHVNLYCGKPPRFKCPHCDYKSLLKRNIKDHAFRMHSDIDAKVIELYNPAESNKSGGETQKVVSFFF